MKYVTHTTVGSVKKASFKHSDHTVTIETTGLPLSARKVFSEISLSHEELIKLCDFIEGGFKTFNPYSKEYLICPHCERNDCGGCK